MIASINYAIIRYDSVIILSYPSLIKVYAADKPKQQYFFIVQFIGLFQFGLWHVVHKIQILNKY